jgi:hypothetical protein
MSSHIVDEHTKRHIHALRDHNDCKNAHFHAQALIYMHCVHAQALIYMHCVARTTVIIQIIQMHTHRRTYMHAPCSNHSEHTPTHEHIGTVACMLSRASVHRHTYESTCMHYLAVIYVPLHLQCTKFATNLISHTFTSMYRLITTLCVCTCYAARRICTIVFGHGHHPVSTLCVLCVPCVVHSFSSHISVCK